MWLFGDGDNSVHHAIQLEVLPCGRDVEKVECANHTMKCFRNQMESLCNSHPEYQGWYGLSQTPMKQNTHGDGCAIKMHSATGDVNALHRNLRNGNYFGDHQQCSSTFCKQSATG